MPTGDNWDDPHGLHAEDSGDHLKLAENILNRTQSAKIPTDSLRYLDQQVARAQVHALIALVESATSRQRTITPALDPPLASTRDTIFDIMAELDSEFVLKRIPTEPWITIRAELPDHQHTYLWRADTRWLHQNGQVASEGLLHSIIGFNVVSTPAMNAVTDAKYKEKVRREIVKAVLDQVVEEYARSEADWYDVVARKFGVSYE